MQQNTSNQYSHLTLRDLTDKLYKDYYQPIASMLPNITAKLEEISASATADLAGNYTDACRQLVRSVTDYIGHFKDSLQPYIQDLYEKDKTGHNCSTCSGGCNMGHNSHLLMITESHLQISSLLYNIQKAAMPFYFNSRYPQIYQSLRNDMLLADDLLKELFAVEEAYLVAGIITSQKKINVHN